MQSQSFENGHDLFQRALVCAQTRARIAEEHNQQQNDAMHKQNDKLNKLLLRLSFRAWAVLCRIRRGRRWAVIKQGYCISERK